MSLPHTFFIGRGLSADGIENISNFKSQTASGTLFLYQDAGSTSRFTFKASGEFLVAMMGASGRKGKYTNAFSGAGGAGYAKISASPNQIFSVFVGNGGSAYGVPFYQGGYRGEGSGSFNSIRAGSGGSGTFMWEGDVANPSLSNIIACVGGGGGCAGDGGNSASKFAGHGGGFLQNGGTGNGQSGQTGQGGTQSAGGARATSTHGHGANNHTAGSAFQGGRGSDSQYDGGCGGGSGYYGGGGGAVGGGYDGGMGGGGSGYLRTSGNNAAVAGSYAGNTNSGASSFNFGTGGFNNNLISASGTSEDPIAFIGGTSRGSCRTVENTDGKSGGIVIWAA